MIFDKLSKFLYYSNPIRISRRGACLKALRCCRDSPLIICGVGVGRGDNALNMLRFMPIDHLYLIDPYIPYIEDSDNIRIYSVEHIDERTIAYSKLSPYNDKISFIYKHSNIAIKLFEDNFFDFVYINGNHSLIYEDMTLWYPKVKQGGILAGHDVNHRKVLDSFIRFIQEYNIKEYGIGDCEEQLHPDWWLVKT